MRQKRAEDVKREQFAESEQMLHALFEFNPQPIAVLNEKGQFVRANSAARLMSGYSFDEFYLKRFDQIIAEEERKKAIVYSKHAFKGVPQTFETVFYHKEGYKIELNVTAIPIRSDEIEHVHSLVLVLQDITSSKQSLERIKYMAYYDDMTGIPNRRYFRDQLENALHLAVHNKTNIAVFYVDIDRFKLFNDTFGFDVGNILLLQVAERLSRCVTSHDVLARMDGDEFAIFYTDAGDMEEVAKLADQIRSTLEQSFECQGYDLTITVSMGISISDQPGIDAEQLMKQADIALSRAKELGRDTYQFYSESMQRGSLDRLTMESDMRAALQKGEFVLYYQPQVNIVTGECIGVEGLIRWNHPDKGLVMPGDFISLAEENGMIVPIGDWVIEEACRQSIKWRELGLPSIPVSVNLSVRQFLNPSLCDRIAEILSQTGMEPGLLELEITESVASDVEYAQRVLQRLKQLGVRICIDDFGTGYSSLYYLRSFPITRLKIDRSFVRDISSDQHDAQIVETIIAMAKHMNLKVIAEGVESDDQITFLKHHHCEEVQGYYFSKPLPAVEITDWMKNRKLA